MALTEQSSVVFSIQQLVDSETERVAAERAKQEAAHGRKRELQRKIAERERLHTEQQIALNREAEQRQALRLETETLQAQLRASNASELERMRLTLEQEYLDKTERCASKVNSLSGRQRMLGAALTTILAGAGLFWLMVVIPGQRQARDSYAALNSLYESSSKERRTVEDALRHERQQLRQQLDALLLQAHSKPGVPEPSIKPTGPNSKPLLPAKPALKPRCTCVATDPLCACLP